MEKINKDMKLNEVVQKYPATLEVFLKRGMPKIEMKRLPSETIYFFSRVHRVDLNLLLAELNKAAGLEG